MKTSATMQICVLPETVANVIQMQIYVKIKTNAAYWMKIANQIKQFISEYPQRKFI